LERTMRTKAESDACVNCGAAVNAIVTGNEKRKRIVW
jgi:hypothetical protein